ncbi:MAG: hypothetical protein JWO44_664 [Bacteroidetes bacterium]|nr:hypothetical protein [Bacteroidota bacterium]
MQALKIIYRASIVFICVIVATAILGQALPLEFADNESENLYLGICFYGIPLAIVLTLTGTLKQTDTPASATGKIILTLVIAGLSFFVTVIAAFTSMCEWSTHRVCFENKQDPSVKIVEREFGCGVFDSGEPAYKLFKVSEFSPYMIWATEADTNKIDKAEWRRVENL